MITLPEGMETLIESMNENQPSSVVGSEAIGNYSPEDWMIVLDNDLLSSNGKETLAEKCPADQEFLPILKQIAMGNGFGVSLAREIYSRERQEEIRGLIDSYRVNEARDKNQQIHNLGSMLGDRKAFFWGLNILFSKSVMKGIKDSIWSKEGPARLSAIKSLDNYNIDDTEMVYLRVLDDTDKELRDEALTALKKKVPADRLARVLEEEQEEASALLASIDDAKHALYEKLSEIGDVAVSFGKTIFEKASSGIDFLSTEASALSSPIKSIWGKFNKKDSSEAQEAPEALFALCIGLSWTDGEIEKSEKEMLSSILINNKLHKEFAYWLIERPEFSELKPYLRKVKQPEKIFIEMTENLRLQVKGESEMEWIREIEKALGIKETIVARSEVQNVA